MGYRTVSVAWWPSSRAGWRTFSAARLEAARLWSWLVERHAEARRTRTCWPTKGDLEKETTRQFPNLHSQSVQQTVGDFCEAIASAESLRKQGEPYEYPWKKPRYRQVIFTNQAVRQRDGCLLLPCGRAGTLKVRLPNTVQFPGRLMEVRLNYGSLDIVCEVAEQPQSEEAAIGVDLGVNTVIAATDGDKAVLVSGRAVKAVIQLRNKRLAEIGSEQSRMTNGSRRYKRMQRRKYRSLDKARNAVRDLCHKASRQVADAFPDARVFVGEPFNDACQKMGRIQAQTVSQTCTRRIIEQLNYKLAIAIEVPEAYSSQTCPVCGRRSKQRRIFRCVCGLVLPRDVVGSVNVRSVGMCGAIRPGCGVPNVIISKHPAKYPGSGQVVGRTPRMSLASARSLRL